ncbi:hypothetical protein D3C83_86720 [compost metagenome]
MSVPAAGIQAAGIVELEQRRVVDQAGNRPEAALAFVQQSGHLLRIRQVATDRRRPHAAGGNFFGE